MRKTIEEHNREILENFFYSLDDYKRLSLDDASELNKMYLKTEDPVVKESIKEELIRGTQHFIYNFLSTGDFSLGNQSVVDMEDLISFVRVYLAEGIEYGLFNNAHVLMKNGLKKNIKTIEELVEFTSQEFRIDLLNYKLFNMNADKIKKSKCIFNELFLVDFYTYIATGKTIDDPLQQVKETASYDNIEDMYADTPDQLAFDLLHFLDDNDLLITKDIYEEHFFGDRAVKTGKIRRQDFFLTNQLSGGTLFEVIQAHPAFKSFRDRYKAL